MSSPHCPKPLFMFVTNLMSSGETTLHKTEIILLFAVIITFKGYSQQMFKRL
jgi:hypothetical protein